MEHEPIRTLSRRLPLLLGVVFAVLLAGCTPGGRASADDLLARHQLGDASVRTIIDRLEATSDDKEAGLAGSVRPDRLVLTDDQGEQTLPIEDQFYLSVAPWVTRTHECFFHNLATCQGELADQKVQVKVVGSNQAVLIDQRRSTHANGFVGLWLPKNITGTLTITHQGRSASTPIGTGPEDPTCLTTMKLT